jgi:ankyrin repeat protein
VISLILRLGRNPNHPDESGDTPFHEAARHGHCEVVQMLLDSGASIDAKNKRRYTPLQWVILGNEVAAEQRRRY